MRKETLVTPGSWARLKDASEMSRGAQRAITKAASRVSPGVQEAMQRNRVRIKAAQRQGVKPPTADELEQFIPSPEDVQALEDSNDACVLALVADWSYEASVSPEGLAEIPLQDYRYLQALCAPAIEAAAVDFSPTPEAVADQNSPFGSSDASSGSSEVVSSTEASPKSFATTV
ncbi:MAG: hypothetical protein WBF51_04230 [Candidatus Dormiibacterota bacterium]